MLVKSISEIKSLFPNNTYKEFDKFEAYIRSAERTFLVPVLGIPLHDKLSELYDDEGLNITDKHYRKLLELVQIPIIQFATHKALPYLNVVFNEAGGLTVTTNNNTVAASKDRTDKVLDSTLTDAWDAVDYLLEYLERNSKQFVSDDGQELWKQSEWYWQQTGLLIFTASEFENAGVYIEKKRRKFIQLLPSLRLMERSYVRPAIGERQTDEIIRRKMNGGLSDADLEVLPLLQSALALYTKAYDPELNRPEDTHGYNSQGAAKMAAENLIRAMRKMKGNAEDYPFFPGNEPDRKPQEYARTDSNDPFFLLSGFTTNDKRIP